jgi:TetR/AcrR family transcriptional regulator, transcriptional repressor for nem operon
MGRVSNAKERLMEAVSELIWTGSYGSTTIDHICEKAGVKKGSFYYFFDSKADLALAAVDAGWNRIKPELEALFSPAVPPLDRLRKYCVYSYRFQSEIKAKYGHVLGCPQFSLGSEVGTQEGCLPQKIQGILECKRKYFESAIRDARDAGLIDAPDPAAKSRTLFAYDEGLLTQARIQNDLNVLREAERGMFELLGVKETDVATTESNVRQR